jgi:ATP-binding cassette, subfamily B, bacterial
MSKKSKKSLATPSSISFGVLVGQYRPYFVWLAIAALVSNSLTLFIPRSIGQLIDSHGAAFPLVAVLILCGTVVGALIAALVEGFISSRLGEQVAFDVRAKLMAKITHQPYQFVQKTGADTLLTLLTSDVTNLKQVIAQGIFQIAAALILFVGATAMMFVTNAGLAWIALASVPVIGLLFFGIFKVGGAGKLFEEVQKNNAILNRFISETVFGAALVRVVNGGHTEQSRFAAPNAEAKTYNYQIIRLFSILFPIISLILSVTGAILLYLGGVRVVHAGFSLGQLVAFLSYFALLSIPIFIIGFGTQFLARGFISLGRIAKILDEPEMVHGGSHEAVLTGSLTVQDVLVEKNGRAILKNVSFSLKPGTKNALVGPTGAGKTQLLNILTSLLAADSGSVQYDGVEIGNWSTRSLLSQIGLVFQQSIIFNASVRENIAFGDVVDEQRLKKALLVSNSDEFIAQLPQKLDTVISERGGDLSGGQKQRLMLARALYLEPKLLLLDDFTARVDTKTEQKILANLAEQYPTTTILNITQKVETIKNYDQIIVLEEGEIMGIGTHTELLKTSSEYAQIVRSQQIIPL